MPTLIDRDGNPVDLTGEIGKDVCDVMVKPTDATCLGCASVMRAEVHQEHIGICRAHGVMLTLIGSALDYGEFNSIKIDAFRCSECLDAERDDEKTRG